MARKSSSTAVQEELYPLPQRPPEYDSSERQPSEDSRLIDLEAEQESPFLRGQKRVNVRRGSLPKKAANGLKWAASVFVILAMLGVAAMALYRYGKHSWRFRIDSSDQVEVVGAQHVSHAQIMEVMGGDIGRNIFFVPLAQRQQQLEQIPWVESASVMRFVPNRLRIEIHERTPVAFARIGAHISLIDAGGNLMELAPGPKHSGASGAPGSGVTPRKYSFPVITGISSAEPISTRAARMKNYNELMRQLDAGGARYSQEISEVDLSDPDDAKVMTSDANGEVLVHLGAANYLQRYRIYVTHVQAWRQQFDKLDSVDLRYDGQIIVNPDLQGIVRQPALTPAAAKAALAAGVKNAAIVNYEKYATHPELSEPAKKPVQLKPAPATQSLVKGRAKVPVRVAHRALTKAQAKSKSAATKSAQPQAVAPAREDHNQAAAKAAHASANTKPAAAPITNPAVSAQNTAAQKTAVARETPPAAPKPAPAAPSAASIASSHRKPSPAIPKETPHN